MENSESKPEDLLEILSEINPDAAYPTDLVGAIIGYVEQFGQTPKILLDRSKCIEIFKTRDGMSDEEAEEFFEYNVLGAHVGENPCFAVLLKDLL